MFEAREFVEGGGLDSDYRNFVSAAWPQRSFEGLFTAVYYQYQVQNGWTVQPNFQYIIHPGGWATSPSGAFPGQPLKNAAAFGIRTTLKF
jgi:porin